MQVTGRVVARTSSRILSLGAETIDHLIDSRVTSSCNVAGQHSSGANTSSTYLQIAYGLHVDVDSEIHSITRIRLFDDFRNLKETHKQRQLSVEK